VFDKESGVFTRMRFDLKDKNGIEPWFGDEDLIWFYFDHK